MRLRHYLSILLAFAVVAGVVGTAYLRDSSEFGDMEVIALFGKVEIQRGNSVIGVGTSPESLEPQDVVVTANKSSARLKLEDGRTVSLGSKTRLRIRSTDSVEPQAGSILAVAKGAPTEVLFDDVTARFSTAMVRVDRGVGSVRAAALEGQARLESRGEPRLQLTRLMQAQVAAGDLPQSSVPYRLNVNDAWDTEYLARVVTLTEELEDLMTGFARQVGDSRPGLPYFADLADGNVNFMTPYLSRPLPDLLVGFTIADNDPDSSLKSSFKKALRYLDQGATYGVAATLLGVNGRPLVAQLNNMIVGTGAVAADGGAGEATFGEATLSGAASSGASGDTTLASSGEETVSGGVEGESTGTVDDCANVVDCGVQDVQDELPPGPGPNTEPEEEEDPPTSTLPGSDDLLKDGGLLTNK